MIGPGRLRRHPSSVVGRRPGYRAIETRRTVIETSRTAIETRRTARTTHRADPTHGPPIVSASHAPQRGPGHVPLPAPSAATGGTGRVSTPTGSTRPEWLETLRSPGRILAAALAWPPVGLAAALLFGEITGCARFAVECADATSVWPWLIQLVTIAAFLLAPAIARIAVVGTFAILVTATPLTLFLMTGGRAGSDIAGPLLFAGLAIAWVVGVAVGVGRSIKRPSAGSEGSPPVP